MSLPPAAPLLEVEEIHTYYGKSQFWTASRSK